MESSNTQSFLTSVEMESSQPFLRSVEGLNEVLSMNQPPFIDASSSKSSYAQFDSEIISAKAFTENESRRSSQHNKVKRLNKLEVVIGFY